jgi:hypothetical protein
MFSEWDDSCSKLAKTMEGELLWKAREAQNDAIQWGADVESSASSEEGWPGVPADAVWPSLYENEPLRTHGWLSVGGGVMVEVEVRSVVKEVGGHSACRCL